MNAKSPARLKNSIADFAELLRASNNLQKTQANEAGHPSATVTGRDQQIRDVSTVSDEIRNREPAGQ